MEQSPKIKMIKKDAIMDIKIGTGFLQRLQKMLIYLSKDASEEDMRRYGEMAKNNEEFTEDWMEHLMTMTILLKEIETKAEEQGHTYEDDIPVTPVDNQ